MGREVYSFPKVGVSLASRMNKFLNGEFINSMNLKDGFALSDCEDIQARTVLEL